MLVSALIAILTFISTFVLSLVSLKSVRLNHFWVLLGIGVTSILTAFFLTSPHLGALSPFSITEIVLVFAGSSIIYLAYSSPKLKKFSFLSILISVLICSFLYPLNLVLFEGLVPLYLDRIFLLFFWFLFVFCFPYLNSLKGIISSQIISITFGIFALSFLNALPLVLGLYALIFTGIFTAFILYRNQLSLNPGAVAAFGFITAWLLTKTSLEGMAPCSLVFCMFLIYEVLFGFIKSQLPNQSAKSISTCTSFFSAYLTGLNEANVLISVIKINFLLLILGCFEIYAPNNYSIPLVSLLIVIWFTSRLRNWKEPQKTIRDLNKDLLDKLSSKAKDN